MYNKRNIPQLGILERGYAVLGILQAAGYDAYVVGGILRTLVHGGETSDLDIAVVCATTDELEKLKADLNIFYRVNKFEQMHERSYEDMGSSYMADWRGHGGINIIAYRGLNIREVLQDFDYSFNAYYSSHATHIDNPYGVGHKQVLPIRYNVTKRDIERYKRFYAMYPDLDWSIVHEHS